MKFILKSDWTLFFILKETGLLAVECIADIKLSFGTSVLRGEMWLNAALMFSMGHGKCFFLLGKARTEGEVIP